MRKLMPFLVFCLLLAAPAFALFCVKCGSKLADTARFCAECGTKVVPAAVKESAVKKAESVKKAIPTVPEPERGETYRLKADLYVYENRGDEHNILKKNLFFKPRRYKIPRDTRIKIIEHVGDTYLVQSIPVDGGTSSRGWVTEAELTLRSDWVRK